MGVYRMPFRTGFSRILAAYRFLGKLTLETDSVAFQTLHGLFEETLASRGEAGDIVLFPFNRGIDMLEDLLDRIGNFCTDTITRDQSDLCINPFSILSV
jgi:hypothetical protein